MVLQGLPAGGQIILGQVRSKVLRVEDVDDSLTSGVDSPVTVLESNGLVGLGRVVKLKLQLLRSS